MNIREMLSSARTALIAGLSLLGVTTGAQAATYSDTVLADGPLAYWRLGEASSAGPATNLGSLGAAANGAYTVGSTLGAPSLLASDPGNTAYSVLGTNRMVTPAVEKFAGGTGYTAEYWVKLNALPSGGCCVNILGDGDSGGDFFFMNYDLAPAQGLQGAVRAHFGTTGNTVAIATPTALQASKAAYVVSTWDQATGVGSIYIDGKLSISQVVGTNGPGAASNNAFYVGQDNRGVDGSNMTVDDPAFYSKALSAAQIRQHYTKGRQVDSILLSTDVMIGDTTLTGAGNLGDGFNNNSAKSTIELVRFIPNSNAAPLNVAFSQNPANTIDFSPFVVAGATAGTLGANIHGRGSTLFLPGDGETIVSNNGGVGFGAHANWLITFDLDDMDFEHFGTRDLSLLLTGRFGMNGQGGPGETVNPGGQVQGLIYLDGVLIDTSPLQDVTDPSHPFSLTLPNTGRFLTFAIVNGDPSSFFDDGTFRDVRLTVIPVPEPATLSLLGFAGLALLRRRRTA